MLTELELTSFPNLLRACKLMSRTCAQVTVHLFCISTNNTNVAIYDLGIIIKYG